MENKSCYICKRKEITTICNGCDKFCCKSCTKNIVLVHNNFIFHTPIMIKRCSRCRQFYARSEETNCCIF